MSNFNVFPIAPNEPTLDDMLLVEAARVNHEMDPFTATRHNQRMEVAAGYVRQFLKDRRGEKDDLPKPIGLSNIVILDPSAVADAVAPELGPNDKARIADMVLNLADHARRYLAERRPAVQEIPTYLAGTEFIQYRLAHHIPHPIQQSRVQKRRIRGRGERNDGFPLDEYCAVYVWIDRWSKETNDEDLRTIAQDACDSLHSVGEILLDTMRSMRKRK